MSLLAPKQHISSNPRSTLQLQSIPRMLKYWRVFLPISYVHFYNIDYIKIKKLFLSNKFVIKKSLRTYMRHIFSGLHN